MPCSGFHSSPALRICESTIVIPGFFGDSHASDNRHFKPLEEWPEAFRLERADRCKFIDLPQTKMLRVNKIKQFLADSDFHLFLHVGALSGLFDASD